MIPETLDAQIDRLIALGFHVSAGLSADEFSSRASELQDAFDEADGTTPILVASRDLVGAAKLTEVIDRDDGAPEAIIHAEDLQRYEAVPVVEEPSEDFYLLLGFDRGPETRNMPPKDALAELTDRGRSPLTIEEGLAVFAQWPDCVWENDGFSLAGSTRGDKRVPAIWKSKKKPKLGWCFLGAPHTWLSTASCESRCVN